MPSIRFPFEDLTRQELSARIQSKFGPSARVVSAQEVRVGGVGGFFARRYVDVVVDVPPGAAAIASGSGAVGLAALLEEAERAERAERRPSGVPVIPVVSTQTEDFAQLMAELRSYSEVPRAGLLRGAGAPALHDTAGGIILFVGLGEDALVVARSLARTVPSSEVRMGGRILGDALPRVDDRRQAAAFRAQCIQNESVGLLAWGIGLGATQVQSSLAILHAIDADQIWIVVDVSRKPADTAAWVGAVRASVAAQAIAVLHGVETGTPDTVNELGLPVGWSDTVG
ncbi:MAG: hypothetical protein HIU88_00545 [Acidobacteria bacterium]|nr:hypothetical protein [Acidobacteriota bacterium]